MIRLVEVRIDLTVQGSAGAAAFRSLLLDEDNAGQLIKSFIKHRGLRPWSQWNPSPLPAPNSTWRNQLHVALPGDQQLWAWLKDFVEKNISDQLLRITMVISALRWFRGSQSRDAWIIDNLTSLRFQNQPGVMEVERSASAMVSPLQNCMRWKRSSKGMHDTRLATQTI